jgi:hypothetical protein
MKCCVAPDGQSQESIIVKETSKARNGAPPQPLVKIPPPIGRNFGGGRQRNGIFLPGALPRSPAKNSFSLALPAPVSIFYYIPTQTIKAIRTNSVPTSPTFFTAGTPPKNSLACPLLYWPTQAERRMPGGWINSTDAQHLGRSPPAATARDDRQSPGTRQTTSERS